MDAALKGHPYVKSAIDIACWDILGKATRPAGLRRCSAAASARRSSSTARSRRRAPERWPRASRSYRARGLSPVPAQGRRRSRRGHRPHPRGAREAAAGGRAGRRRQHRLAAARGGARGPRGARRRRLHRAAVPDVTRNAWPCAGAPIHPFVLDENDRRPRRAAARARRSARWTSST